MKEAKLKSPEVIRFNNEQLEVIEKCTIRGERYFTVGKLSRPPRETDRVLKRLGKKRHVEMVLHRLADRAESWKLINRIKKFDGSRMPFPRIDAVGRQAGEILVVRDFVVGKSLRWQLAMNKRISVFRSIQIYQQLVGQICFLHRKTGVIHGDLSPENIIISEKGSSATLIDFGSSFPFSESVSPPPGDGSREIYQAPENLAGEPASRLSEQFSAASIFYELLTGVTPFNIAAKREYPERSSALPPASKNPRSLQTVPPALWRLIDEHLSTALSLDPSGRFPTLDDWQDSANDLKAKAEHPELLQFVGNKRSVIERLLEFFSRP